MNENTESKTMPDEEKPHPVQKFMDNIWLLLILGLAVPFISYTLWGLLELLSIEPAVYP